MSCKDLPLTELYLSVRIVGVLHKNGIFTVGQLTEKKSELGSLGLKPPQIQSVIAALRDRGLGTEQDPSNLSHTNPSNKPVSVTYLPISTRLRNKLLRLGYFEIHNLIDELPELRGSGLSPYQKTQVRLAITKWEGEHEQTVMAPSTNQIDNRSDTSLSFLKVSDRLRQKLLALGYSDILGLPGERKILNQELTYYETRQVLSALTEWHFLADQNSSEVQQAINHQYKAGQRVNFFPAAPLTNFDSNTQLIQCLFQEYISLLPPNMHRVLTARAFVENPEDFQTLEEVGSNLGVTRERVRQIEKKALNNLRELLFGSGVCRSTGLVARPELHEIFAPLLSELESMAEISFGDLSSLVSSLLEINAESLSEIVTLLTPLLAGSVSDQLARTSRKHAQLLNVNLPEEIRQFPISDLRMGKATEGLLREGIVTIEDFLKSSMEPRVHGKSAKKAVEALSNLCRDDDLELADMSLALSKALDLFVSGYAFRDGLAGTYEGFIPWFQSVVGQTLSWALVDEVFRFRTSMPAEKRMTMKNLGLKLGCVAPSIGRIERYILDHMTEFFVHENLSKFLAHAPPRIFQLIRLLRGIYSEANDDYELFITITSHRLDMRESEVKVAAHLFWAILSGKLPNRYWHLSEKARSSSKPKQNKIPHQDIVVKLKGFRKVY